MPLPEHLIVSLLRNIESSGKLYKDYKFSELVKANPKEFGTKDTPEGKKRRLEVSKRLSSIKSYSPHSYFNLILKYSIDPGAALQKELKTLPPVPLEDLDTNSEQPKADGEPKETEEVSDNNSDDKEGTTKHCYRTCFCIGYCLSFLLPLCNKEYEPPQEEYDDRVPEEGDEKTPQNKNSPKSPPLTSPPPRAPPSTPSISTPSILQTKTSERKRLFPSPAMIRTPTIAGGTPSRVETPNRNAGENADELISQLSGLSMESGASSAFEAQYKARALLNQMGCIEDGSEEKPYQIWFNEEKPESHFPFTINHHQDFPFRQVSLPVYEIFMSVHTPDAEEWTLKTAVGWKGFSPAMRHMEHYCLLAEGPAQDCVHQMDRDRWVDFARFNDENAEGPEDKVGYDATVSKFQELQTAMEADLKRKRVHFILIFPAIAGQELMNAMFSHGDPKFVKKCIVDVTLPDPDEPETEYEMADILWRIAAGEGRSIKSAKKSKRARNKGLKRNKKSEDE